MNPGRQILHRNLQILSILILSFSQKSRPALGPAQSLIEWVPGGDAPSWRPQGQLCLLFHCTNVSDFEYFKISSAGNGNAIGGKVSSCGLFLCAGFSAGWFSFKFLVFISVVLV